MKRLTQLRLPVGQEERLEAEVAQALGIPRSQLAAVQVVKRSLDARRKSAPVYVYTVDVWQSGEPLPGDRASLRQHAWSGSRPVIIGAGPGGLFAALRFLDQGVPCVLFERGAEIHPRTVKINMYWKKGLLDPESNVCYGEGGAGLFSDGKLITRIKSPHIRYVLERLVDFGAPPEITWVYNPHVGSDRIRKVMRAMVQYLREKGCELHYETRVDSLRLNADRQVTGVRLADGREVDCEQVVLAPGHSARDLYQSLRDQEVAMVPKDFAMGVRVEHPQALINQIRLGGYADQLGAASYSLTWNQPQASVYSFCMCPGGYVIASSTEADGVVVNGMSNYRRNSRWANAALVTPVSASQAPGEDPFRLLQLQRQVEQKAFAAVQEAGGTKQLPAQRMTDFLSGRRSQDLPDISSPSGAVPTNLEGVLPSFVTRALREALVSFNKQMKGFISPDAVLLAVESRTSAAVRIPRDPATLQSINTPGLYPVGEGAGYAGGITSAAVDGIRAVCAILEPERFEGGSGLQAQAALETAEEGLGSGSQTPDGERSAR